MIRKSVYIKFGFIPLILFLLILATYAQSIDYSADMGSSLTEEAVEGIGNVTASIISDSFTPMTHYTEGDFSVVLVPAYFKVDKLSREGDLQSDDFTGIAAGIGAGYAFSERLMIYGIFSGMKAEGEIYSREFPEYRADAYYEMYTLNAGLGFELIDGVNWSIPVYLGISLQRYKAEITPPRIQQTVPIINQQVTADVYIEGNGLLYGPTFAVAVSRSVFNVFRVTPYYLLLWNLNAPELTAKASAGTNAFTSLKGEYKLKIKETRASMFGLCLTYINSDSLSVSISAGGLIGSATGYYNKKFLDGLEMISIVAALTYSDSADVKIPD